MDDVLSFVVIVALFFILKPVLKAILRGMGSSEPNRDK